MRYLLGLVLLMGCAKAPAPLKPLAYVTIVQPKVADVPLFYEYVGHVEANQSAKVKAQAEGTIMGKFFVEGQEVAENSLLLTIDPRPYQATLDRVQAELAQNLATLRQAQDTQERYFKLLDGEYVSQLDYDQYVTKVLTAEAAVAQSQADIDKAEIDLDYCTIRSPFSGVASKLIIDVGNYVPVGGDPLLTINQISPIRVSFFIPEKDLPKIRPPMKTAVMINDECLVGDLFLIDNQVNEETGTILVQALYPNTDKKLWPGEFVDVRLILKIQKDAILLPSQAVQIGQDGPYVYVVKADQTVELRKVATGQKEDDQIIIETGISPEETVVLEGQLNLTPGAKVMIKS